MQDLKPYKLISTADGSPSLEWSNGEAMHNRKGALSETLEIYGSAFVLSAEKTPSPSVLSVGLGLAYNELMIAGLSLQNQFSSIRLLSFEENDDLRSSWLNWINNNTSELGKTYDEIINRLETHLDFNLLGLKEWIKIKYDKNEWSLQKRLDANSLEANSLSANNSLISKYNCILYDPFSSKTNPECWEEGFINQFLEYAAAPTCILSSYSSKGTLKRALRNSKFEVTTPIGFGGKRNRTLAWRV
jgi:hypothetical protein